MTKENKIRTHKNVATKASQLLKNKNTTEKTKTVAGSALVNRRKK